jgi:hypothetical protein
MINASNNELANEVIWSVIECDVFGHTKLTCRSDVAGIHTDDTHACRAGNVLN